MKTKKSRLSDNVEDVRGYENVRIPKGSMAKPGHRAAKYIYDYNKEDMISNPNLREKERVGNWGNASKEPFKGNAKNKGVGFKDNKPGKDPTPQKGFLKHTIKGKQ